MRTESIERQATSAIQEFKASIKKRGWLTILLRPFFDALPLETRLHLGSDVLAQMAAAHCEAKDHWGARGNVRVTGNRMSVGVRLEDDTFEEKGSGATWIEAFRNAWTAEQKDGAA